MIKVYFVKIDPWLQRVQGVKERCNGYFLGSKLKYLYGNKILVIPRRLVYEI